MFGDNTMTRARVSAFLLCLYITSGMAVAAPHGDVVIGVWECSGVEGSEFEARRIVVNPSGGMSMSNTTTSYNHVLGQRVMTTVQAVGTWNLSGGSLHFHETAVRGCTSFDCTVWPRREVEFSVINNLLHYHLTACAKRSVPHGQSPFDMKLTRRN